MKIAFLDLEFTRKPGSRTFINEIIEVSCITVPILDRYEVKAKGNITSKYEVLNEDEDKVSFSVKPSITPILSAEVIEYTGVLQESVDNAISLDKGIDKLYTYLRKNDVIRVYMYSSYCKNLLLTAKKILNGKQDLKINYIISLLKDISYYADIARKKIDMKLKRIYNFDTKFLLKRLKVKKTLSLSDTYLILMDENEISKKSKNKSLYDASLIKYIYFSDEKSIDKEIKEIATLIEVKRNKLFASVIEQEELIELICAAKTTDELINYKGKDLSKIIRAIVIINNEFKTKIIENPTINMDDIKDDDKWFTMYKKVRSFARDIKSAWGLNIKTVDDCLFILEEENRIQNLDEFEANVISTLMASNDNFTKFKEDIQNLDEDILLAMSKKCKEIMNNYDKGHFFNVYSTKFKIINDIIYRSDI